MSPSTPKRVHIIFTGGTIAMRTNAQGQLVPANSGDELIAAIPDLAQQFTLSTQQLCNVASAHLTSEIWLQLRQAIISACADDTISGVVVVQGTDTLEETAFFLDASLSNDALHNKPIVVTGAMRSADEEGGDGPSNLRNAILAVASSEARGRGAMVGMYGRLHAARHVRKLHTTRTDAFGSLEHEILGEIASINVSANASSNTTDLDTNHAVPQVRFHSPAQRLTPSIDLPDALYSTFQQGAIDLPRVDIVSTHISCDSLLIDTSIKNGAVAIVIQALGAGNVNPNISAAIERALTQGVAIIIASRSHLGEAEPIYGYVGGGQSLVKMGAVMSHDLPAHKARIYAQLLLAQTGATAQPIQTILDGFDRLR